MNVQPLSLDYFVTSLRESKPVSFARMGDGEFYAILGYPGQNCDGCVYYPNLGRALRETLEQPHDYRHGIAPKVMRHRGNGITEASVDWIERHSKVTEWYDTEVLLTASLAGQLRPFIDELRKRKVMIIGPKHLKRLPILGLPVTAFVEVPNQNAWLERYTLLRAIHRAVYECDVLLFSAGMAAKVFIYDLFVPLGKTRWLLDCGSVFDFVVGVDSRSYARKLTVEQKVDLTMKNFGVSEQKAKRSLMK